MSLSAILRELVAAGLSGDALCDAVERIEAAQAPVRSSNAERQQRYRDRMNSVDPVTRNVTSVTSVTPVSLGSDGSPKIISNPSFPPQPSDLPATGVKPKLVAQHIPADFEPEPLTPASQAMVDRWQAGELESQLQRFRDHWAASATATAKKRDWQAAWRTWIGRHNDDRPRNRISMGGNNGAGSAVVQRGNFGAAQRLGERHGTRAAAG